MPGLWRKCRTVGGLLAMVALCGIALSILRRPATDEGQAILLAKDYLRAHGEFNYPQGYWTRAEWNPKSEIWKVGFMPATKHARGSNLQVEVLPDQTCRTAPLDVSVFDLW